MPDKAGLCWKALSKENPISFPLTMTDSLAGCSFSQSRSKTWLTDQHSYTSPAYRPNPGAKG